MRKVLFIVLMALLLIGSSSVFIYAKTGEGAPNWFDKASQQMKKEMQTNLLETFSVGLSKEEKESFFNKSKEKITLFQLLTISNSKEEIKNHREHYLSQLAESKENLDKSDLKEIYQKQKQEVQTEIEEDIEVFLKDLLDE
ncbi:hypothetical protein [Virgibacillus ihumii]|uniref:hypothetical protein n=1 Tax=Virgibacillus ihumii TaxID=2686091 RepID=UPI00157C98DE|nr:hypothetical protein [Virgibacillus ihumii]